MKRLIIGLALISLFSCKHESKPKEEIAERKIAFKEFLKKFKPLELPLTMQVSYDSIIDINLMKEVDFESKDKLFVNEQTKKKLRCYGYLSDTTDSYKLIFFVPADIYYPVLVTYSKSGHLIDEKELLLDGFDENDCGINFANSTALITKDLKITSVDSVKYDFQCDENKAKIPNSGKLTVISRNAEITKEGRIKLDKEVKKEEAQ